MSQCCRTNCSAALAATWLRWTALFSKPIVYKPIRAKPFLVLLVVIGMSWFTDSDSYHRLARMFLHLLCALLTELCVYQMKVNIIPNETFSGFEAICRVANSLAGEGWVSLNSCAVATSAWEPEHCRARPYCCISPCFLCVTSKALPSPQIWVLPLMSFSLILCLCIFSKAKSTNKA